MLTETEFDKQSAAKSQHQNFQTIFTYAGELIEEPPWVSLTSSVSYRDKETNRRLQEAEQKYQEERGRMVILEQTLETMNLDSNKGQ